MVSTFWLQLFDPDYNTSKHMYGDRISSQISSVIEKSTREKIASDRELAERAISTQAIGMENIANAVNNQTVQIVSKLNDLEVVFVDKMDQVSSDIQDVGKKVDRVADEVIKVGQKIDFMHTMLEATSNQLGTLNKSLEELVTIAKTPSQVWAFEQFEQARNAYERHLFDETFDFIERAINGYGDHVGNTLEHRFYMLKGFLHLGGIDVGHHEQVNLQLSQDSFELAARYAKGVNTVDQAFSLRMLGWAYICDGQFDKADVPLKQSISLDTPPDAEAYFLNAKIDCFKGDFNQAKINLAKAIYYNPFYGFKAYNDEHLIIEQSENGLIHESIDAAARPLSLNVGAFSGAVRESLSDIEEKSERFYHKPVLTDENIEKVLEDHATSDTLLTSHKKLNNSVGLYDLANYIKNIQESSGKESIERIFELNDSLHEAEIKLINHYYKKVTDPQEREKGASKDWSYNSSGMSGFLFAIFIILLVFFIDPDIDLDSIMKWYNDFDSTMNQFILLMVGFVCLYLFGRTLDESIHKSIEKNIRNSRNELSDKRVALENNSTQLSDSISVWLDNVGALNSKLQKEFDKFAMSYIESHFKKET